MVATSHDGAALATARAEVEAVRDSPDERLGLLLRTYARPAGRAYRYLRYRRAAASFMRWQLRRGLLAPLDADPPGSAWWRAINERLLLDGCEAVALLDGARGEPSSAAVGFWLEFLGAPSSRHWYRAHNSSIVAGYIAEQGLARSESLPERFFINVALVRVLYAHALVAAPRLALGRLAPLGPLLGDPRMGMAGAFMSLRRVLPDRFPLEQHVNTYIGEENRIGRLLDYAVILPRAAELYAWSAAELREPRLLELVDQRGSLRYAWPADGGEVWRTPAMGLPARALSLATRQPARASGIRAR